MGGSDIRARPRRVRRSSVGGTSQPASIAGGPALRAGAQCDPKAGGEVEYALDRGPPSSTEEHRCLEGGTVWKAREFLNELGLGLPEMFSTGLGEESMHFFLGAPPLWVWTVRSAAGLGLVGVWTVLTSTLVPRFDSSSNQG